MNAASRLPVVVQRGAGHVRHLARNFVGGHGNDSHAAERDQGQGDGIVAGENRKVLRHGIADFRHLADVAAGFLHAGNVRDLSQPRQRGRFDVRAGASGNVVEDDRLVHGFRDGAEVAVLAFLRRLVVVGRSGQDGVDARAGPRASLAFLTASWVEFEVAPATMGTRPAATSTVMSITCSHSS